MARLTCGSRAERLLVPPFVLFFNLLYPMRRVNDPSSRVAAAAGGCILVRRGSPGLPIRLQLSRSDVVSVRPYRTVGPIWRMVRRTAFTQLRHSYALLAVAVGGLALLFALPPARPRHADTIRS